MNKTIKPLVSVIMPVYNGSEFVGEAIESLLAQTYKNFELVIVDDGSKDGTWETLNWYQRRYPKKIKIYRFKKNIGESASANFAFKKSKGEFIARMDADDIAHPKRLEKQVKFLLKNKEVIVLGTQAKVIDKEGNIIGKKVFPTTHEQIYKEYAIFHPMLNPSCMIRKDLLPQKDFLYEDKLEPNDDYYTLFKLLSFGKFANLNQFLLSYRVHSKNKSLQNPKRKFLNSLKVRLSAIKNFGYRPTLKAWLLILTQVLVVFCLPEALIVPVYIFFRGMCSPETLFSKLTSRINLSFPTTKRLSLPLQQA